MNAERIPAARAALDTDYEILRELGRGGTAVVYLARKRSTGAEVAIKLIRSTYLEDEEALARFAREARFAARVSHPNVVPILEVIALNSGGIALVMAHVGGKTLKQLIRDDGRMSPAQAERIVREIASGLNAAHSIGIIHRDVKPENVFIDETGRAMLADFGLARSTMADTQLTMTGVAIGTPAYMPPEQIDGGVIDIRGDVYSLGLVAWEMLTGHRPWEGDSLYALLYHQKHDFLPDVREMRPDVPHRFADVIATAIEKDPAARWQSVTDMIGALDGTVAVLRAPIRPPASNETTRFIRGTPSETRAQAPAAAPAARNSDPHDLTLALIASELETKTKTRRRWRTAVGGVVAVLLIAGAVIGARWLPPDNPWREKVDAMLASRSPELAPSSVIATPVVPTDSLASTRAADSMRVVDSLRAADSAYAVARLADSVAKHLSTASADVKRSAPLSPALDATVPSVPLGKPKAAVAKTVTPPPVQTQTPAPAEPAPMTPRVSIAAGGMHTCLLSADGRGFCWGENNRGQLGVTGTTRASTPTPIGGELGLVAVSTGLSHSCAIARGGGAWCWGENDHGQLGDHTSTTHSAPERIGYNHTFHEITAGAAHSCALDKDSTAWCWGAGTHGQLGNGSMIDANAPVPVSNLHFSTIDAGWNFTCALDDGHRAYCWGENRSGQLGNGDTNDRREPTALATDLTFSAIAAGSAHACGVTAQGDAYCWGRNNSGQLGDGTKIDHATPTRVKSNAHFVSVTAGAVHSCAISSDGAAYCWGLDSYGQLGDGGNGSQPLPVPVTGGHNFSSLRAFGSHTCGTTVSGEAFCWGYNLDGQLGDGTRINRSRPVYLEPPTSR